MVDKRGFFYIIQNAEIPLGIYKIGKTTRGNPNQRLCEYPKFSEVKFTIAVDDIDEFEKYVIRKFTLRWTRKREYGLEYFEGNYKDMIKYAVELWLNFDVDVLEKNQTLELIKPIGIDVFISDWLLHQSPRPSMEEQYIKYVELIQEVFLHDEYASYEVFEQYMTQLMI